MSDDHPSLKYTFYPFEEVITFPSYFSSIKITNTDLGIIKNAPDKWLTWINFARHIGELIIRDAKLMDINIEIMLMCKEDESCIGYFEPGSVNMIPERNDFDFETKSPKIELIILYNNDEYKKLDDTWGVLLCSAVNSFKKTISY